MRFPKRDFQKDHVFVVCVKALLQIKPPSVESSVILEEQTIKMLTNDLVTGRRDAQFNCQIQDNSVF